MCVLLQVFIIRFCHATPVEVRLSNPNQFNICSNRSMCFRRVTFRFVTMLRKESDFIINCRKIKMNCSLSLILLDLLS